MPYRRRTFGYRRPYGRRPAYKRKARMARTIRSTVLRMGTMKYYDFPFTNQGVGTGGIYNGLASIPLGATNVPGGSAQRLGPKIFISHLYVSIRFTASLQSTISTADIYNHIRCMIVRCTATQADLNTGFFPTIDAPYNPTQEFRLIKDKLFFLNNYASGLAAAGSNYASTPSERIWKCRIPYRKIVTYAGTGGSTDSRNAPAVYFVSDSGLAPNPTINGYIRIYFKDIV